MSNLTKKPSIRHNTFNKTTIEERLQNKEVNFEVRRKTILELQKNITLEGFRSYRDNPAFQEYAQSNSWATRAERGYPDRADVFSYVRDVYGAWIGHGLVQADLKADPGLYAQFQKRMSVLRKKSLLPAWVEADLPKERSAAAFAMRDDPTISPEQRLIRKYERERKARWKAVRPSGTKLISS